MTTITNTRVADRADNKRGISSPPSHRGKGTIPGVGPLASMVKVPRLEREKNESAIRFEGMSPEKAEAVKVGLTLLELHSNFFLEEIRMKFN